MRPFLILLFILSCSSTKNNINTDNFKSAMPKENVTALLWKPNVLPQDFNIESIESFKNVDFCIEMFNDSRESTENIGTINQGDLTKTVIPDKNIAQWCTKNLEQAYQFLRLKSVNKSCDYSIEGEITGFSIHQDVTLHGHISFNLSFLKDGLTVWEGRIEGTSELYLIPSGTDGVSECMSNTLIYSVYNLLNDKSFIDAVIKSKE